MAAEINLIKGSAADHPSLSAAILAASSLFDDVPKSLSKAFAGEVDELLVGGDDRIDLLWREPLNGAAAGARILKGFQVSPANRHLELAAAIVRDGHADATIAHGWPILSVSSSHLLTRTEGEGRKSLPGGH